MRRPTPCLLLPALLISLAGSAHAQAEDGLKLRAAIAETYDSNYSQTTVAAPERIDTTTLGLTYRKAYSLQRIDLDLNLVDYRFQNDDASDYTASNYKAAWRWSFTPRLRGNLIADRKEAPNNPVENDGSTGRKQRTDTTTGFDGIYELTGGWRVLAGVSKEKQLTEKANQADRDFRANAAYVGARYDFASGSNLSYTYKNSSGNYLGTGSAVSGDYDQTDSDVRLRWMASGKVTANVNAGYVHRTHPSSSTNKDYSGVNSGVNVNWNVTGKTALSAGWTRVLGSYQPSYSQTDRFTVGPTWQFSPKTFVGLRYDISRFDTFGALPRHDKTRDIALTVVWQPTYSATIKATLENVTRSSNLASANFSGHQATISAGYSF